MSYKYVSLTEPPYTILTLSLHHPYIFFTHGQTWSVIDGVKKESNKLTTGC